MRDIQPDTGIDATFLRATEKAVLVKVEDEEHWIPKSLITESDPELEIAEKGDKITLLIAEWFAKNEGLI